MGIGERSEGILMKAQIAMLTEMIQMLDIRATEKNASIIVECLRILRGMNESMNEKEDKECTV